MIKKVNLFAFCKRMAMKKNYVMFVIVGLISICTFPAAAQEVRHITQNEAVRLAIVNNLSLESQRITTAGLKRKSDLFWNQFIPSATLSGGGLLMNEKVEAVETPLGTTEVSQWTTNWGLNVQLQLAIFALGDGIKSLRLDYENGVITYDKAKLQLERDIRKSYNSILLMENQLNLLQQSLDNAKEAAESARLSYQAGRSPELQWLQAEVTAKNKQPSIDQLKNSLTMAKNQLAMNCGLDFDTVSLELEPLREGSAFVTLNMEELVRQALDRKPDILEMKAQLKTVKTQRKAQFLSYWTPALSLGWSTGASFTQITGPGENDFFEPDDWKKSGSAGLTIGLAWTATNLLPFSANAQTIKSTDDNIAKLSIGLTQLIQGTELEVYNKLYALQQIKQSMEAQQSTLELAERSYSATRTAYNNGLQSFLQVDQSEEQLRSARFDMQQQKYDYIANLIDLEYSIGVPFGTYSLLKETQENIGEGEKNE